MNAKGNLRALCDWIEEEAGIFFPEDHANTILQAAHSRMKGLGLGFPEFLIQLKGSRDERRIFLDAVTIGETYFFREERQFALLMSAILPPLFYAGQSLSFWSAGASSGEEAISLACSVEEVARRLGTIRPYSILATDLSHTALSTLGAGRYARSSFRLDGQALQGLLLGWESEDGLAWIADPDILKRIEARPLNLLKDETPPEKAFDIVFLRNTFIYMRPAMRSRILDRILPCLKPGGLFFVGSAETASISHPLLNRREAEGVFFFERLGGAEAQKPKSQPDKKASQALPAPHERRKASRPRAAQASRPVADKSLDAIIRQAAAMDSPGHEGGPPPPEDAPLETRAAAIVLETARALSNGQADAAAFQVGLLEGMIHENALTLYLEGVCERARGRPREAVSRWVRSLAFDPGFWPSSFQAGFALSSGEPARARSLLAECLAALDNRSEGDTHYRVILDGFDRSYYRMMTERLMERLDGRG